LLKILWKFIALLGHGYLFLLMPLAQTRLPDGWQADICG